MNIFTLTGVFVLVDGESGLSRSVGTSGTDGRPRPTAMPPSVRKYNQSNSPFFSSK